MSFLSNIVLYMRLSRHTQIETLRKFRETGSQEIKNTMHKRQPQPSKNSGGKKRKHKRVVEGRLVQTITSPRSTYTGFQGSAPSSSVELGTRTCSGL